MNVAPLWLILRRYWSLAVRCQAPWFVVILASLVAGTVADDERSSQPSSFQARQAVAVLPLPVSDLSHLPLSELLVRHPDVHANAPREAKAATQLESAVKALETIIVAPPRGASLSELHERAMFAYAGLAAYVEDRVAGRTGFGMTDAPAKLAGYRAGVGRHGAALARIASGPVRDRAIYMAAMAAWLDGQADGAAVALSRLTLQGLGVDLYRRAYAVRLLIAAESDQKSQREAARTGLRQAGQQATGVTKLVLQLALAKSLAVNGSRNATPAARQAYRPQLATTGGIVATLPHQLTNEERQAVLAAMIAIWRRGDGDSLVWSRPPFNLVPFADDIGAKAVIERAALAEFAAGRQAQGFAKLESLALSLDGRPERGSIDLRILDLRRLDAERLAKPAIYTTALLRSRGVYSSGTPIGSSEAALARARAILADVEQRHAQYVERVCADAEADGVGLGVRQEAIRLAAELAGLSSDSALQRRLALHQARLLASVGRHREASVRFDQLAAATPRGSEVQRQEAIRLFGQAIRSASIVAGWPEAAPWSQAVGPGDAAARTYLGEIYLRLQAVSAPTYDWLVAAQVGWIERATGLGEQGTARWRQQLGRDPRGNHAAHAAGLLMTEAQAGRRWSEVEALSRLCLGKGLTPLAATGEVVSAAELLAIGLLEGGREALQSGQVKIAVAKLEEYVRVFTRHPRHDVGIYLLAFAYRHAGRHPDAVAALRQLVDSHPNSVYMAQALLAGGDWAAPMGLEDEVLFFHGQYVSRFGAGNQAVRVRRGLVSLHLGQGHYADALTVLHELARRAPSPEATAAAAQILTIEERQGSPERALQVAESVLLNPASGDEARVAALAVKGRLFASTGQVAALRGVESALKIMGSLAAQDALGEVRLALARAQATDLVKSTYNLELTDPSRTLSERYAAFLRVRSAFVQVCQAGTTSACPSAMVQLAQLSLDFAKSIEDIAIQETLDEQAVAAFKSLRQRVMTDAASSAERADNTALSAVQGGATGPGWAESVLWQSAAEFGAAKVSGEAGSGYLQWSRGPGLPQVVQIGGGGAIIGGKAGGYYSAERQSRNPEQRLTAALANGDGEAAISLAKAKLKQQPGDEVSLAKLSVALAETRNYDLAAYYAHLLLKVRPEHPVALNVQGLAVVMAQNPRLKDYRLAEDLFTRAIAAAQDQVAPALNLAALRLELGNAKGAYLAYQTAASRCLRCSVALMGAGVSASRAGLSDEAKAAFTAVLSQEPNQPVALYNLALLARTAYRDPAAAEGYLTQLLRGPLREGRSVAAPSGLKERAQMLLRSIKAERSPADRRGDRDEDSVLSE